MKTTTAFAIANSAMWIGVSIAVGIGIFVTKDMRCLWFLIIPLCGGYSVKTTEKQVARDNSIQIQNKGETE